MVTLPIRTVGLPVYERPNVQRSSDAVWFSQFSGDQVVDCMYDSSGRHKFDLGGYGHVTINTNGDVYQDCKSIVDVVFHGLSMPLAEPSWNLRNTLSRGHR